LRVAVGLVDGARELFVLAMPLIDPRHSDAIRPALEQVAAARRARHGDAQFPRCAHHHLDAHHNAPQLAANKMTSNIGKSISRAFDPPSCDACAVLLFP
jgi:hypothetical protein